MQASVSVRSVLMAGVSVIGAGTMAVSPVQPSLPSVPRVESASVALAAFPDPGVVWQAVAQEVFHNIGNLGTAFFAAPFPILSNLLSNLNIYAQIGSQAIFQTIGSMGQAFVNTTIPDIKAGFQSLVSGDLYGAYNYSVDAVLAPLKPLTLLQAPLTQIGTNPVYNLANVFQNLATPTSIGNLAIGAVGPLISWAGAIWASVQNVVNNIAIKDWKGAWNALLSAPAIGVDGLLDGGYGPAWAQIGGYDLISGGLLNIGFPTVPYVNPLQQVYANGLIASWLQARVTISDALCPAGGCTNPTPPLAAVKAAATRTPAAAAVSAAAAPAAAAATPTAPAAAAAPATPAAAPATATATSRAAASVKAPTVAPAAAAATSGSSSSTAKVHRGASRKAAPSAG